jgi:hypothetical protein
MGKETMAGEPRFSRWREPAAEFTKASTAIEAERESFMTARVEGQENRNWGDDQFRTWDGICILMLYNAIFLACRGGNEIGRLLGCLEATEASSAVIKPELLLLGWALHEKDLRSILQHERLLVVEEWGVENWVAQKEQRHRRNS